ncbi:DNA mismatch endonuclease Vsr [Agromyces sp. Q22]|uniref:DNA mismatch endonuclease Vsr n=2 Tax=Agromyces kandeliae TaxID=2666141 RepID=A0A6L5R372_9MICO|nr:DNA mismatch endonuclease Vsr [Agromyces kandeliae]
MVANRSRDTSPEKAVRSLLHARGLRYRVHTRPVVALPRTADIVFTRRRIAVFIDGCFWHVCPEHGHIPHSNVEYWEPKLRGNQLRDRETDDALRDAGWSVLRFWEHESPDAVADAIERTVRLEPSNPTTT